MVERSITSKQQNRTTNLPLFDKGAELIRGKVHSVEVGQAVLSLDFVNLETDLSERVFLVVVQIGQRNLKNTVLQVVIGIFQTLSSVDKSLADVANLKERGGFDIVPVFTGEGVDAK